MCRSNFSEDVHLFGHLKSRISLVFVGVKIDNLVISFIELAPDRHSLGRSIIVVCLLIANRKLLFSFSHLPFWNSFNFTLDFFTFFQMIKVCSVDSGELPLLVEQANTG